MLKTTTRLSCCFASGLAGLLLTVNAVAQVGNLDAPAGPTAAGSAMYTLQDLCNRLSNGALGEKRTGPFAEPTAGPAATMCTLNQIMAAMPTVDDANGAVVADVLAGKTLWSLRSGAGVWGGPRTGTMVNRGAFNLTCATGDQTVNAGYYSGGTLVGNSFLAAENIKSGVILFGVTGTYAGTTCTGTAEAADVLLNETFSNGVGIGLSGSMPNITTDQASTAQEVGLGVINLTAPQGYYDGTDKVTATDAQVAALDADITAANIKKDVQIFGVTGTYTPSATFSASFPVAKTGDATENGGTPKGATWPSPRFADNGNGTVTDNLTGLVWLKDAGCAGTRTWAAAMSWAATLATGQSCNPNLSDGSVVGQWRLPNIKELSSLVDAGASSSPVLPVLPSGHPFTGVQSSIYWSSTVSVPVAGNKAWSMSLINGDVSTIPKPFPWLVWPVRGGLAPPAPVAPIITSAATRFTDNSNGTVTDSITGLIWLKDLNCSTASRNAWATALTAVATLASGACSLTDGSTAGQWRLPSRNELQSLIDYSTSSPALPSGHPFTGVQIDVYWSSTTHADNVSNAWFVSLNTGNVFITSKIAAFYVWPVRGGL
ncbi:MAG: DUF1566 domain-containing protein [Candidatus Competibacteraceae bacterium]